MLRCALAVLFLLTGYAHGAEGLTPQQQRVRACNTQAKEKGLEKRERSRFITDCLNGRKGKRPLTPIQAKNEACNQEADHRRLDGAARRGFMSECVKPDQVKEETAHGTRVRNCNRRADGRKLDGEDRSRFIHGCLDAAGVVDG